MCVWDSLTHTGSVLLQIPFAIHTLRMEPFLDSNPLSHAYTAVELTRYGGGVVTLPLSGSSNRGHMVTEIQQGRS